MIEMILDETTLGLQHRGSTHTSHLSLTLSRGHYAQHISTSLSVDVSGPMSSAFSPRGICALVRAGPVAVDPYTLMQHN